MGCVVLRICVMPNCNNGSILSIAACLGLVNSLFNSINCIKAQNICIYSVEVFTTEPTNIISVGIIVTDFIEGNAINHEYVARLH